MKKLVYIVISLMLFAICSPIANAAITRSVSGTFNVVAPPSLENIEFYVDASATETLAQPVDMGDIPQGYVLSYPFYAKNTGDIALTLNAHTSYVQTGYVASVSPGILTLATDEIVEVTVTISVATDAAAGTREFTVNFWN